MDMQQQKPLAAKRKALVKNTARRALSFAKFKLVTAIEKVRGFLSELQWGIVERNIKNGGNPDARVEGGFGTTYLILAAKTGNEKMVRFLLEHGASTEIRDFRDMTALMHAAAGNSPWSVILLLEHGADPIARDYYFGMTAMDRAKEAGNKRAEMPLAVEMARRLIGTQGWAYFSRNFAECTSPLFQSPAQ
jgi:hypothetical protein